MRLRITGVVVAALAAAAALAPAAASAGDAVQNGPADTPGLGTWSSNWAGYWTQVPHTEGVQAFMIVPAINCATSRGHKPFRVSWWVGLGGKQGTALVQDGISAQCDTRQSLPVYHAWWELVPTYNGPGSGEQDLPIAVAGGDRVEMEVYGPAMTGRPRYYAFHVDVNDTMATNDQGQVPAVTLARNDVLGYTAEAIAELPSGPGGFGLPDFGKVTFHYAFAYTRDAPYVPALTTHKLPLYQWDADGVRQTVMLPSAPWANPGHPGSSFSVRFTGKW